MTVAVCIVGYRNAGEIADCLDALSRTTYADFEVIICENGGTPAYEELIAAVGNCMPGGQPVTCIDAGANLGYAGGVNVAMRARPGASAWWIVNPDTRPEPEALVELMARLGRGDVAAVSSTLCHPDGQVQAFGGHWRRWLGRAESIGHGSAARHSPPNPSVEARMNYILGASMLVGRSMVDTVGLMREDYFLYCEEVEWGLRARAAGLRFGFSPDAFVIHGQGGTTGSADPLHERPRMPIYLDERNKIHVTRDTAPLCLVTAIPAGLALLSLRYAARGAWRQWGYALGGWWAGVRGERGRPGWLDSAR